MKKITVLLSLILSSCTYEIGDNNMYHDKRILDRDDPGLLGDIITFDPGLVLASENGNTIVSRFRPWKQINSDDKKEPSIVTLAIESNVASDFPVLLNNGTQLLQGVLEFGSGAGQQGTTLGASLPTLGNTVLDPRIIFDISAGVMLSFPASFLKLGLLYTSVLATPPGFATNDRIGPPFSISFSLGYEEQSASEVTSTQLAPTVNLVSGGAGVAFFPKPKYADKIFFQWSAWNTGAQSPVQIDFFNAAGNNIWTIPNYTNNPIPPSIIDWPSDAVAVSITNLGVAAINQVRAVTILSF